MVSFGHSQVFLDDEDVMKVSSMLWKLEICLQLVRFAYEFVMVFIAEAVDYALQQANRSQSIYFSSNPYPNY
ncbi:hypothetical protein Hanom_Chr10g00931181 [Helianthus anomalus]